MSRCEYDTVFYRVFCLTLLAVALTFTVILTDVFVDLDGLLTDKEKAKPPKPPPTTINHDLSELSRAINIQIPDKSEDFYEDKDYQDSNDLYRNKRSLVSDKSDRIFQIQDPKVKKLLTEHLASLLDELDEQNNMKITTEENNNKIDLENIEMDKYNEYTIHKNKSKENELQDKEDVVSISERFKENKDLVSNNNDQVQKDYKAELLHLAMHNMILQGIIENTDLDMIYKKVADLVMDSEKDNSKLNKDELRNLFKNVKIFEKHTESDEEPSSDEFRNFKKLFQQKQFSHRKNMKVTTENNNMQKTVTGNPKDSNVIIKTIIDITAMANDKTNNNSDLNIKDKINGIIKVIYNGNMIKFQRTNDDKNTNSQTILNKLLDQKQVGNTSQKNNSNIGERYGNKIHASDQSFYQKVFYDYLKRLNGTDSLEHEKVFSSKRFKRHVKIRFENKKTTSKPKTKKDDEKVFVEIETHFDTKGAKGDQKKKLIKDLIQKIQNAIHSDDDAHAHKKKQKHWNVKKRIQDPLNSKSAATLINKLIIPLETLAHRHLDPISKTVPVHEDMPLVTHNFDRNHWGRRYISDKPRFFGKSINSAELNMVDIDYNKVMRQSGIPQRLQKPINTDISDEVFQDSKIVDIGNIKFLMKDIDGTGFSIGFNQYTDEAPDPETMKLFSGLENVIQTYHQQYDQETNSDARQENSFDNTMNISPGEIDTEEHADKSEQHNIQRRSILTSKENDYHPNRYKIVYGHNILPYKNYNEIFGKNKPTISKIKNMKIYKMKTAEKSAFIIDEKVFDKNLKPSEILTIADMLQRKKRSIKVKKISNVKIKSNINKYLNTKKMALKAVFNSKKHKKRSKRQINKIRIIARDLPQQGKSEEDNVFLVSDEKLFADRAIVKEIEVPEVEPINNVQSDEHYDITLPQQEEEPFEVSQTQGANENTENNFDIFDQYSTDNLNPSEEFSRRARHNSLMSKYPHIITNEAPRLARRNHDDIELEDVQQQDDSESTTVSVIPTLIDISSPNEQDLADLIKPPKELNSYRLSVKIRPKNATNMSGYKEVHTSINKSYNKNGLIYTSLVNVSQLSKVEKLSKNISRRGNNEQIEHKVDQEGLKQQQDFIKTLIQQHKHRLDMQLKHLQTEKQKLEAMDRDNFEENTRPINTKKIRKLFQNETKKKLILETTSVETKAETTTTEPTTTVTTTTQRVETTTDDVIKLKMIETIQRNENVTSELLKKIDQNTGVLKIFLGKLISTIAPKTEKTNDNQDRSNNNNESSTNNPSLATKQPTNDIKENSHIPFNFEDYHIIPNMLLRNMPRGTNNSYGIPFVYAVQRPYGVMPNRENMASVVYHGHIHTNTMNDMKRDKKSPAKIVMKEKVKIVPDKKINDFWKPKPGEKVIQDFVVNKNNTRFFLDDSPHYKDSNGQEKNLFTINTVNATKM